MRLVEIMSRNVETATSREPVERARERMRRRGIHHLVVMEGADIVRVISDRDLDRGGEVVGEIITSPPVFGEPDMTIKRAANLLRGHAIGCLPVVEQGRLVGIVTISDLLELIGRGAQRPSPRRERRTLPRRGPRRAWS